MNTTVMVGVLTYGDRTGSSHLSLHGTEVSAHAALMAVLRERWAASGLAPATNSLTDKQVIDLHWCADDEDEHDTPRERWWKLVWMPVTLDLMVTITSRAGALSDARDARHLMRQFDKACEGDSNDAVESAGCELRDTVGEYARFLERAVKN